MTAPADRPAAVRRDPVMPPEERAVYRVDWLHGTDVLRGTCHCGAAIESDDPVQIWARLLAHPRHG